MVGGGSGYTFRPGGGIFPKGPKSVGIFELRWFWGAWLYVYGGVSGRTRGGYIVFIKGTLGSLPEVGSYQKWSWLGEIYESY